MKLWTAQYRYPGPYRLDITVKAQDPIGKIFAPTWDMVMKHKKASTMYNTISANQDYTEEYKNLMIASYDSDTSIWEEILSREYVVLVCFCPFKSFCHRNILAGYFKTLGAEYLGEIVDFSKYKKG